MLRLFPLLFISLLLISSCTTESQLYGPCTNDDECVDNVAELQCYQSPYAGGAFCSRWCHAEGEAGSCVEHEDCKSGCCLISGDQDGYCISFMMEQPPTLGGGMFSPCQSDNHCTGDNSSCLTTQNSSHPFCSKQCSVPDAYPDECMTSSQIEGNNICGTSGCCYITDIDEENKGYGWCVPGL